MIKPKLSRVLVTLWFIVGTFLLVITVVAQRDRGVRGGSHKPRKLAPALCGLGRHKLATTQVRRAKPYTIKERIRLKQAGGGVVALAPDVAPVEVTVLVVHTSLVTTYLGGKPEVERHVRAAEVQANVALTNSALPLHINVVRIEEVSFPESHVFDTDLQKAAFGTQGQRIRELRETYHADQVCLIVDDGDMGGLAYGLHPRWDEDGQPSPLDSGQSDYWSQRAFYEVRDDCIDESYKCFAHELAHNFGAGHDYEDYLRLFADSHGFAFDPPDDDPDEGKVGTMMSYDGANHRKLYFSNPQVKYAGKATGNSTHNNARAIKASMTMVSSYR
jgi:hypothetical protein